MSFAALLLVASIILADPPTSPRLEPIDVFQLECAVDPQISPAGDRVVYVRRSFDVQRDRARGRLWIVNTDGSGHRPLTASADDLDESSPRWSPDGTRIGYVQAGDGDAEIHVRWMEDGTSARVTQVEKPPRDLAWSPDGKWIAFRMFVQRDPESWLKLPAAPEGATWAPAPKLIEDVTYRTDGGGYVTAGDQHLFVVPADGGTARQVTSGPFDFDAPAWSPTGRTLLTAVNRRDDRELVRGDTDLVEVALGGDDLVPRTDRRGPDGQPAVSTAGRIAYVGYDEARMSYHQPRMYVLDPDQAAREVLTDLDLPKGSPQWSSDGEWLYFLATDRGNTRVMRTDLNGRHETVAVDVGGTSFGRPYGGGSFSLSRDGAVAFPMTRPDHPADVGVVTRDGGLRRLTHLNDDLFAVKPAAAVEPLTWASSADGQEVHGWFATPPDFDDERKYPLLLEIHGGPHADYGDRYSAEIQLYAAMGYVVLYTNPRGSTSYGESFANAIHHAYPGDDYFDLMSGVDALISRGFIDEDRLFVTGGSGGGVLTAWIVGSTDRFRAAVVCKPVINWTSFVLTADMYPYFTSHWFPSMPWDDPQHYWDRSPLSRVGNVHTPTMLLTGEADYRTPIAESEQFYQALKLRGVDTALVRIPEASHGITARPSNLARKVSIITQWFARHDVPADS